MIINYIMFGVIFLIFVLAVHGQGFADFIKASPISYGAKVTGTLLFCLIIVAIWPYALYRRVVWHLSK